MFEMKNHVFIIIPNTQEKLLNDIVEIIAQLQVPYGAPACVKVSK